MNLSFRSAAAVLIASAAIGAAPPADAPAPDWSNVETVIVTAKVPGPAMWHVVKGNSEVWILPTVAPTPKSQSWDTRQMKAALDHATVLLTPPKGDIGVVEGLWFLMWHRDTLEQPDGIKLESTLPDALRARFVAARNALHKDADHYQDYLAAVAAIMLENDYRSANDLVLDGPQKTVEALASQAGVSVRPIASYPAMDVVHDVPKMSVATQQACLADAVTDIETQRAHAAAAAEAWANGDIDSVKANFVEDRGADCFKGNASLMSLWQRGIADTTNAVLAALNKPGKTVVIVPLNEFLKQKSVLDRLAAMPGVTISGPGS